MFKTCGYRAHENSLTSRITHAFYTCLSLKNNDVSKSPAYKQLFNHRFLGLLHTPINIFISVKQKLSTMYTGLTIKAAMFKFTYKYNNKGLGI